MAKSAVCFFLCSEARCPNPLAGLVSGFLNGFKISLIYISKLFHITERHIIICSMGLF